MIVPRYYENLSILHEGTMPARAYYIPASRRMDDLAEHREESDRIRFLNGIWKFRFFESIYDVQEPFFEPGYDTSDFGEIRVPGVWQMAGYDSHQYTNIRYPFPFDPPFVPQDNPCGAYVYTFDYAKDEQAPKAYLNFEGVDSCFYVWLNGTWIGYSQVSHGTSEFDVTSALREGENTIAVLVLKWCDGSYLEDQDKFRMSGIFRDVYLLKRPENCIGDYRVETVVDEGSRSGSGQQDIESALPSGGTGTDSAGSADMDCDRPGPLLRADRAEVRLHISYIGKPVAAKVTVYDPTDRIAASGEAKSEHISLEVPDPELWSAEHPVLYTLVIETEQEVITDHIGFRTIRIQDQVIYLNGQKVKFHGVNRHDSDPETGFAISMEQMMKDLTMMKQHNFNAIRSSHYPNAPYFYQLCDRYGFMVMDEADVEAHGPNMIYYKEDTDYNRSKGWNRRIADDPAWKGAILDRVRLMVQRDKNRPCILMWSMGNESAYGCNFEKALLWTKKFDPGRITQYESARYRNYDVTYDYSNLDLYSRMYPAFEEIREYFEKDGSKPFLLVEYAHSMGNGPGDLEDYFQLIHSNDRMCGGFVWEWCDHAMYAGRGENGSGTAAPGQGGNSSGTAAPGQGKDGSGTAAPGQEKNGRKRYLYGGDHGEKIHDGNFCLDGLVYPDRTPHTGLLEYKNVHRPARVVSYDAQTKELRLHNYLDFTDLKDYAEIRYEVACDGICVESGSIPAFSVPPHGEASAVLDVSVPRAGRVYLRILYQLRSDAPLVPTGHPLGFDEILLENEDGRNQDAVRRLSREDVPGCCMEVSETDCSVAIRGNGFSYTYNKKNGLFESIIYGGTEYLDRPMEINIWRAPTDNDMYIREEWEKAHYHEASARAYATAACQSENEVVLLCAMSVSAPTVQRILDIKAVWTVDKNGGIHGSMDVSKNGEFPMLPRFGVRLFLPEQMDAVSYYGYGPMESYRDKHRAASHGRYTANAAELHEDYIHPQENGSHYDCDYVEVSGSRAGLTAVSAPDSRFSFNASVYTQEELEEKPHNFELERSGSTILCLDYAQNGIGSNSCGPEVMEKYRFDETRFRFQFSLVPFVKEP